MSFYVYMLKNVGSKIIKTYVGYTINLEKRLINHNIGKGAKSTKGHKWKVIYKKKFNTKSKAMSFEYFLKKNRTLRKKIINEKKYSNNFTI